MFQLLDSGGYVGVSVWRSVVKDVRREKLRAALEVKCNNHKHLFSLGLFKKPQFYDFGKWDPDVWTLGTVHTDTYICIVSSKWIRLIFKLIYTRLSPQHVSSYVDCGMCFALSSCPVLPLPIFCIFSWTAIPNAAVINTQLYLSTWSTLCCGHHSYKDPWITVPQVHRNLCPLTVWHAFEKQFNFPVYWIWTRAGQCFDSYTSMDNI